MTLTEPAAAPAPDDSTPRTASPALVPSEHVQQQGREAWTLRRMFVLGAGLIALILVTAILLGGMALSGLTDARTQLLDDIGPAVRANQDLAVAVLNQETGVRGYALTGRPEFLEPYRAGQQQEAAALAVIRAHLGDRLADTAPTDAVAAAAREWRAGYAEQVVARPDAAPDPAVGKASFDALRARTAALTAVLDAERIDARNRLVSTADALRWYGVGIAGVVAAVIALAAWGVRRGVLEPVEALATQVRDVVSGDVHREVRAAGPREIVELGGDVEAMRVHISREVDLLQEANRRLDDQAQDLERSNRDLEQFAYVASHDLQEPLRKVSSFCQLLQRRYGGQLDERADQYIAFAVDGAQRMQRLINDLLAFSRVGRTTTDFEPVDLREIALAAAAQLDTTREERDGEIVVGDLPRVRGDSALLRQLLLNLMGNGLKFHRPDVPPVVRVEAQRVDEQGRTDAEGGDHGGDRWEFAVADNGIGIEPEYADKIFVIFQRLHGREVYGGTGIGLSLAKKIVEFHGGRVWLDTSPRDEPGTVVRFTLPVAPEPDPEPAADPAGAGRTPQENP